MSDDNTAKAADHYRHHRAQAEDYECAALAVLDKIGTDVDHGKAARVINQQLGAALKLAEVHAHLAVAAASMQQISVRQVRL